MAAAVLAAGGHAGACYDVTGPEAYAAAELAALYAELGRRPVVERPVSDAELVAAMVGSAGQATTTGASAPSSSRRSDGRSARVT